MGRKKTFILKSYNSIKTIKIILRHHIRFKNQSWKWKTCRKSFLIKGRAFPLALLEFHTNPVIYHMTYSTLQYEQIRADADSFYSSAKSLILE